VTHQEPTATIAIFAVNSIVRATLPLLLEGQGYDVRLLEAPPAGVAVNGLLDGVDIVLLGTDHVNGRREGFLSGMRSDPKMATIPVLTLLSAASMGEAPKDDQNGVTTVPWPSFIETLVKHIETALEPPLAVGPGE
jgi:hypothetical protein